MANFYTPGTFTVGKSHNNLAVRCQKPHYSPVTGVDENHFNGWIFGNIVFGGGIGAIVNLNTAADELYGESIHIIIPENNPNNKTIDSTYRTINFEAN